MNRAILSHEKINPEALSTMVGFHSTTVVEVMKAIESNKVVVVGMAQNPFVKKARNALEKAGVAYKYLEYGSYVSQWKQRLAIKMWSGWSTYPQVFVDGKLLGGFNEMEAALKTGKLKDL